MQQKIAAVSCSPNGYRLGGVKFGFWLTGKLGRAWVVAWVHGGDVVMMWWGVIRGDKLLKLVWNRF